MKAWSLLGLSLVVACGGNTNAGGPDAERPRSDGGRAPGPPSDSCGSVRLTSYEIFARGWCEFDTSYDFLPRFVRDGMTAAIAEPWSSGEGDRAGEACGECWEIDTVNGTEVVMITDLCPTEGNPLCAGGHFHIDLANPAARAVGGGALDEGQARRVPCPVDGDIHVLANDENVRYLRVAFLNHRVPVRSVEFRGAGPGVTGPNEWTPLLRSGGAWEVVGGDTTTDRGGTGVQFRLTSAQGQTVESDVVVPSHPERGSTFSLGVQFEDRVGSSGGSCDFVPPGDVFVEGWGGIDEVRWSINPWGEAERGFFGETRDGCFEGSCLEVAQLAQWTGFHLYYRQLFPRDVFSRARMRLRTRSGTTELVVSGSSDGERCRETRVTVGEEWTEVTLDLVSSCSSLSTLNGLTIDNGGNRVSLLLDDVRLEQ
jgi:hypothetical protein